MPVTARTTRPPTGIEPPPMILVDGKEATSKTYSALSLSRDERIGRAYVVEVGEMKADAYAVLGDFEMVEHDGTIEDVVDAINWVMDQPPIDERPALLIIDSLTAVWDLVKMDAERRARSTKAAQKALESDPHAAITVAPNHWSSAKEPFWYGWLNRARHWPGITVCCARGDEVLSFDDNGKPIPNSTTYRVEVEKGAPFMFGARVKVDYPRPARLLWANKLDLTIPTGGLELPIDGTLAHVVFELLDAGKEASYRGQAAKQMVLASARARGLLNTDAKALAAQAWTEAGLPDKGVDRVPLATMRKILDIVAAAPIEGDEVTRAKAIFDRIPPSGVDQLDSALADSGMSAVDLVDLPLEDWSDVAAKVVLDWYATQRPATAA